MHRGRREHYSLKVTQKRHAEKRSRIAGLIESGLCSRLRNRTEAKDKTFADVVEEFIEKGFPQTRRRRGYWSESTIQQSKSTLNLLVRELGELAIGDVDPEAIEAYLARLRDEGKSTGTRNRHLAIVRVLLAKAHEWGATRPPTRGARSARSEWAKGAPTLPGGGVGPLAARAGGPTPCHRHRLPGDYGAAN